MTSPVVHEAINRQINAELGASYAYLAMSAFCARQNFQRLRALAPPPEPGGIWPRDEAVRLPAGPRRHRRTEGDGRAEEHLRLDSRRVRSRARSRSRKSAARSTCSTSWRSRRRPTRPPWNSSGSSRNRSRKRSRRARSSRASGWSATTRARCSISIANWAPRTTGRGVAGIQVSIGEGHRHDVADGTTAHRDRSWLDRFRPARRAATARAGAPLPIPGRSIVATRQGIVAASQPLAARAGVADPRTRRQRRRRRHCRQRRHGPHGAAPATASAATCSSSTTTRRRARRYGLNASGWAPTGLTPATARAPRASKKMPQRGVYSVTVPGVVAGWARAARAVRHAANSTSCSRRRSTTRKKASRCRRSSPATGAGPDR